MDWSSVGAVSVPVAATLISAGWGLCFRILVQPLSERLTAMEARLATYEDREAARMKRLEEKAGW